MNIDKIKKFIKGNPRLECLYMYLQSFKDENIAKEMVGIKRNPNNLIVKNYGNLNEDKTIYCILFDEDAQFNGFCSLFRLTLMYLAYAEEMMLTPVVYYGKHTLYYDKSIKDTENVFEYYFNPVSEINYRTIKKK